MLQKYTTFPIRRLSTNIPASQPTIDVNTKKTANPGSECLAPLANKLYHTPFNVQAHTVHKAAHIRSHLRPELINSHNSCLKGKGHHQIQCKRRRSRINAYKSIVLTAMAGRSVAATNLIIWTHDAPWYSLSRVCAFPAQNLAAIAGGHAAAHIIKWALVASRCSLPVSAGDAAACAKRTGKLTVAMVAIFARFTRGWFVCCIKTVHESFAASFATRLNSIAVLGARHTRNGRPVSCIAWVV